MLPVFLEPPTHAKRLSRGVRPRRPPTEAPPLTRSRWRHVHPSLYHRHLANKTSTMVAGCWPRSPSPAAPALGQLASRHRRATDYLAR